MKQRQWRTTIEEEKKRELERARYKSHECYTDADKDRPEVICDTNGQVCLSLCKLCGLGEAELFNAMCERIKKVI